MARKPSRSKEVGALINAHLKRFEADPEINQYSDDRKGRLHPYWNASASARGGRVFVVYISYQGSTSLTLAEAEAYLAWLDAGNEGRHFEQQRGSKPAQSA